MATLAGNTIASTYPLLLKIDSNGIDGTLRAVQDGDATDSALKIATDGISVGGTLTVDQDANSIGISVDGEQTTANGIDARFDALTTGKGLYVYSDSSSNGTRQLVQFENDNTGATGTTVLKLRNDADSYGMLIDQNGNSQALRIDSESTTDNVISILSESTTGNVIYADCDTLTTGSLIKVESNSSTTDTRNLVQVINDHASATGATCLFVDQAAYQKALFID